MTIAEEVAAAFRFARREAMLTPEDFAAEMNRLLGRYPLDSQQVKAIEAGEHTPTAEMLIAAARIARQPVSVCLGEMDSLMATLPDIDQRLHRLETLLVEHGVIPSL